MVKRKYKQCQVGLTDFQRKILVTIASDLGLTYTSNLVSGGDQIGSLSLLMRRIADGQIQLLIPQTNELIYVNSFSSDGNVTIDIQKQVVNLG